MSNRKALFLFLLLVGLLVVGAIVGKRSRHSVSPLSSSYSASPRGLKALYLYLQGSGIAVERHLRNFENLPGGMRNMIVVSEPSSMEISARESKYLLNWVRRGNVLVLASRCGEGRMRAALDLNLLSAIGIQCESKEQWQQEFSSGRIDLFPSALPWNAGIKQVSAKSANIPTIKSSQGASVLESGSLSVALYIPMGAGSVLFLATSSILENSEIGRRNNLQFIWNPIRFNNVSTVLFDEFHHGFQQKFSSRSVISLRALSYTAALLVAMIILFAFAGSNRMGPPARALIKRGRSASETIESLALLFLRGRKHRSLCVALQQNLSSGLNKKYQLASDLSNWRQFLEVHGSRIGAGAPLKELLEMQIPSRVKPDFLQQYAAGVDDWRKKLRL
jgi:hypothetical protein